MVSTLSDDPPSLGWIYVNKDTRAISYGPRKDTTGHVIGPWGWTADEQYVSLRGRHDQFVLVREEVENDDDDESDDEDDAGENDRWAIYWDPDGKLQEIKGEEWCRALLLRRKMLMGMDSRYIRDSDRK